MQLGLLFSLVLVLSGLAAARCPRADCIALSEIKALRFGPREFTAGRRVAPEPKLQVTPDYLTRRVTDAHCRNAGVNDVGEIMWDCIIDHDSSIKVVSQDVVCEGYGYSGDTNVLAGSCRLMLEVRDLNPPPPVDLVDLSWYAAAALMLSLAACLVWIVVTVLCSIPRYISEWLYRPRASAERPHPPPPRDSTPPPRRSRTYSFSSLGPSRAYSRRPTPPPAYTETVHQESPPPRQQQQQQQQTVVVNTSHHHHQTSTPGFSFSAALFGSHGTHHRHTYEGSAQPYTPPPPVATKTTSRKLAGTKTL